MGLDSGFRVKGRKDPAHYLLSNGSRGQLSNILFGDTMVPRVRLDPPFGVEYFM